MTSDNKGRDYWGSGTGFILAAAGSAVGLGNIWKFPYITGEYGGGAFVLVYLLCIVVVGLPLLYAEMIIGKRGGKDVLGALRTLTDGSAPGRRWVTSLTGFMAVASGFLILSFYSVVAGWAIHFFIISLGMIPMEEGAQAAFTAVAESKSLSSVWHTVFMVMTALVVSAGIHKGIEVLCKILMPLLIGILIILFGYCCFKMDVMAALSFLFKPDFSKLSGEAIIEALGHAFFTLSLGMGAMLTYGSYIKSDAHIVRDGFWVAILDTGIALLAGTVIFSVVFHFGKEPSAGPGLLFMTLPDLFAQMPGGVIVASAFFLLIIFAAWSSAVSLLEVVVAYFVDERGMKRKTATWVMAGLIWLLGLASALNGNVLDFLDNLTTRYMLPIGGLLIAIIAGWWLKDADRVSGFKALPAKWGRHMEAVWTVLIRYVTPILVLLVILAKMGLIKFR
jgi:neurotransmitter:Na+ symporter, NSS family